MSAEADVLLDGEEETGLQEEISQEDADKLLAEDEEYAYAEYATGEEGNEEWVEQEGVEGEVDGEGEAVEETEEIATDDAESKTEEKKENGTAETKQNYFRGGPRGRMMMMMRGMPFHPRFMLRPGMRPPPGFMPPPFMMRPGMRPPPGFRGRMMMHPRMRMRMPMRPFPPGHPMFRPGMRPMFRPGMRPPFPVPFPMGMMMGGEEEWEGEGEEEENEDGAKKIQTVIAGDPKTDRKRQAPMGPGGDHYNAAKRGRGAGGVFLRGAPPNMRGAPPQMRGAPPHMQRGGRGGAMSYRPPNPVHQQTYVQPVRTVVEAPVKSGTGQCHSNLRTIQCTDTPPQSQARPQVAAVPQYRGGHNQYRVHVHHAPPPTLTSVPIQMSLPRSDKKVLVQNLPASVSYDSIKNMAVQYGPITSLEFKTHEKSAVIEFVSPNSAELFQRTHNRKMMDLAIITVTRLM